MGGSDSVIGSKLNPIGRMMRSIAEPNPATEYQIVGVIKDTKYAGLREPIPPETFAPIPQFPKPAPWEIVYVRAAAPASAVAAALKKTVGERYPAINIAVHVFKTEIQNGLIADRLMAGLSGFFGVLAALLASIRVYGVISYIVLKRRNEIGIRMALGASRQEVVSMIMREAGLLLAAGIAAGLLISFAATRSASALLFGLQPHDRLTLASAAVLWALITAVAAFWPALRASRLDPLTALRWE